MSAILDIIVKSSKITDYLASKGVSWSSHDGNRYRYKCPFPDHQKDNTPSFFVYEKGDRQDFCCFGCKKSGNLIHLISGYEQISIKETIKNLSEGLDIKIDDVLNSLLKEIIIYSEQEQKEDKNEDIIANSIFISSHMHDFLVKVEFNKEDMEIANKVFQLADSLIFIEHSDNLEKLANSLSERTRIRYNIFLEKKKQQEILNSRQRQNLID